MAEETFSKNNGDFFNVSKDGISAITGSTYVRYSDSNGSWVRIKITVPSGHKWTISEIYTTYTAFCNTDYSAGYGFTKEARDVYDYERNSVFDHTAPKGTAGSAAGTTYKSSGLSITLDSGTWYLYVYMATKGGAWQFVATSNTKIKLTYTDELSSVVYIGTDAYEAYIENGTVFDLFGADLDNGTGWDECG